MADTRHDHRPRPPSTAERLAALEASHADHTAILTAIKSETAEMATLRKALTEPTTPGGKSVVDVMREAAVRDVSLTYLAGRIKNMLGWVAGVGGVLAALLAARALGWWGE
jgi:hypothetical protein